MATQPDVSFGLTSSSPADRSVSYRLTRRQLLQQMH
jgi:hypothetical protein